MPGHDHWCAPLCTNRQDWCTNPASTHFHAKNIFALNSSLPIGEMKGNTSRFSQRCCLQRALLAYRLPTLDKVWRGRGGLASVLAKSRVWDQGQFRRSFCTSESQSCARRLINVDRKLMIDSVVCLWLLVFQYLYCCHWRLLSGRQILLARSAVSVMISLPPPPPSLSIYLSRSPSLLCPLPVSFSLTHFVPILCVSLSGTPVHLHGRAVTVCCCASLLMPLGTTHTLAWKSNGKRNGVL